MFKKTAKSVCLDMKNVTLRTVAYGDNFHITVVEGACVNATVQLQETIAAQCWQAGLSCHVVEDEDL